MMVEFNELNSILDRITATGTYTEADRLALINALRVDGKGNVVIQIGKYNIHIEQGQDIQIGDNITYGGTDADAIRQTIRQMLDEYRLRPGIPFQAPPLPEHFVPRPEVTNTLKDRLLTKRPTAPGILVVSAIHGLGGIGKSTLAAALAYDPEVQRRFKDGILWATLGQQPDLISLLNSWIQALGDYNFHRTTMEAASTHLRTLLQNKAALLVVDDVWQPEHALPFLVGGEHSQMLITTRRANVADGVGAELHQMDVMSPEQSLNLLASRLQRSLDETEQEEALQLSRLVGYLPLALELAAARVARGTSWTALRQTLETEVARLQALEGPHHRRGELKLEASFNLSMNALRAEDEKTWQAFVWMGVLPEDVRIAAPMAATLWEMDITEATDEIELLWNDALLLPAPPILIGDQEWPAYRLHDLLHDIALRLLSNVSPDGLGFELSAAHSILLERYKKLTESGLWHTLPDDGYIHAHLTWHMEQAGQVSQIHHLLREDTVEGRNSWYETKERWGYTDSFLVDIERAWCLAEKDNPNSEASVSLGLQCRYALITASFNSLAENIPPELLSALVAKGIWTSEQGLTYARQMPGARQRTQALTGLAPHLSERSLRKVLLMIRAIEDNNIYPTTGALAVLIPRLAELGNFEEAIKFARTIENKQYQALVLLKLVFHLEEENNIEKALALTDEIRYEEYQALVMVELVFRMAKRDNFERALSVARAIEDEEHYARALTGIISRLSELGNLAKVLEAIQAIKNKKKQTQVLAGLVIRLVELGAAEKALTTVQTIKPEVYRAAVLSVLAHQLFTVGDPEKAVMVVQTIENDGYRAQALAQLASHLPESLLQEALLAIRAIEDNEMQAQAFTRLAPYLSESLLSEALSVVWAIEDKEHQAWALTGLVFRLTELGDLTKAISAVRTIEHDKYRTVALVRVISLLSDLDNTEKVLMVARAVEDKEIQARVLARLAFQLIELDDPEKALEVARTIEDNDGRALALTGLVPQLTKLDDREKEMDVARAIEDNVCRMLALAGLTLRLAKQGNLQGALLAIREIEDNELQIQALTWLSLRLVEKGYSEKALTAARSIEDNKYRVQALAQLAPHMSEALLQEALLAVRAIEDNQVQVQALTWLAPYLSESLLPEALGIARTAVKAEEKQALKTGLDSWSVKKDDTRKVLRAAEEAVKAIENQIEALTWLAPHLSEALLQDALLAIRAIGDSKMQVQALTWLSLQLAEKGYPEKALIAARSIEDNEYQAQAFVQLAPHLSESLLQEALLAVQATTKNEMQIKTLSWFALRLIELGYPEKALMVTRPVDDEDNQAKTLVEVILKLAELGDIEKINETGWAVEDEKDQAKALVGLIPRLVELGDPKNALEATWEIEDDVYRGMAVTELAPYLPESFLHMTLGIVRTIKDDGDRLKTLATLAPHLPESIVRDMLTTARIIENDEYQARMLAELAPHLPVSLFREAMGMVKALKDKAYRVRAVAGLAPHLSAPLLRESLSTLRAIEDDKGQARMLAGLAPHLPEPPLREALEIWTIGQEKYQAKALVGLIPRLVELGDSERALAAAQAIWGRDSEWLSVGEALAELILRLAKLGDLPKALATVRSIESEKDRAEALINLAPHLSETLLWKALATTRTFRNVDYQSQVWVELIPRLAELGYPEKALAMMRKLPTQGEFLESSRAKALAGLASHLPKSLLREALEAALELPATHRVEALTGLAPHLSESLLRGTLELIRKSPVQEYPYSQNRYRDDMLAVLIPRLAELGYPDEALATALKLPTDRFFSSRSPRETALTGLAPYLSEPLLQKALEAARELPADQVFLSSPWVTMITGLALRLAELGFPDKALAEIRGLSIQRPLSSLGHDPEVQALIELTLRLTELGYTHEAWAVVQELPSQSELMEGSPQIEALARLAPYLSESQLQEALEVAQGLPLQGKVMGSPRIEALACLAPYLSELQLQKALETTRDLPVQAERPIFPFQYKTLEAVEVRSWQLVGSPRAATLACLAPHLSEPQLREALKIAKDLPLRGNLMGSPRIEALTKLTPRLVELGYPDEALAVMQDLPLEGQLVKSPRVAMLVCLIPHLTSFSQESLVSLWQETLSALSHHSRQNLLKDLFVLTPVIAALGGSEAVVETFHALQDVRRWWP